MIQSIVNTLDRLDIGRMNSPLSHGSNILISSIGYSGNLGLGKMVGTFSSALVQNSQSSRINSVSQRGYYSGAASLPTAIQGGL